ncbi:MAG TPA: type II toxin-antitoxin system VapC family toxin [Polyangia bacterium]|jgi:predicted nucleic-acid-binding protein
MIAVDTNVLVRVLTNDDPTQARRAMALMRSDTMWVSRTVLLETAWVLRHAYGLEDSTIGNSFATLLAVRGVVVEERADVVRALAWHSAGMDFADALHLTASGATEAFATFDHALARTARRCGATPRVIAP